IRAQVRTEDHAGRSLPVSASVYDGSSVPVYGPSASGDRKSNRYVGNRVVKRIGSFHNQRVRQHLSSNSVLIVTADDGNGRQRSSAGRNGDRSRSGPVI